MTKTSDKKTTRKTDGFGVGHLNIFHLANKVSDLAMFFKQRPHLHVFGVSESRLKASVTDNVISIPNFSIYRRDADIPG